MEKEVGKILFEGPDTFLWEIPRFFMQMNSKVEKCFYSPGFFYGTNSWIFRMDTGSLFENPKEKWISIQVDNKNIFDTNDRIGKYGLRKENGVTYCSVDENNFIFGSACLMPVSQFFKKQPEFAPKGRVTFFAQFFSNRNRSTSLLVAALPSIPALESISGERQTSNSFLGESKAENNDLDDLSKNLKDMYLNSRKTDFTFQVKKRKFHVHKCILEARSSVLAAMIQHDEREEKEIEDVTDCEADDFHEFLLYLYSGKVENLIRDNAVGLYTLADKYMVDNLKAKCVDYLKSNISVDTYFDIIQLALKYDESELYELSKQFFVTNAKKIILNPLWHILMKENTTVANELILLVVPS